MKADPGSPNKGRNIMRFSDENAKTLDLEQRQPPSLKRSKSQKVPTKKQPKPTLNRRVSSPVSRMGGKFKRTGLARTDFLLGDFIKTVGVSKKWANGLYGEINGPYSVKKGRWPTSLITINGKEKKINIKPENLVLVDEYSPGDFEVDDLVQLFGLKDTHYNGLVGRIQGEFRKGKWPVILKMGIHKHGIVEEANEEIVNMEHHNLRKVHEGERFHPIANSFCSYAGLQSACMTVDNHCFALERTDYSIHCWNTVTGEYNRIINFPTDLNPTSIRLTPDGKHLVVLGDEIHVYRTKSKELVTTIKRKKDEMGLFHSFDISWDCTTLAVGFAGSSQQFEVKLFDLATCQELDCWEGLAMPTKCVKISRENEYIFSAHQDIIAYRVKPSLCQLRKFEIDTGEIVYNIAHEAEIHFICITSDERYVLVGDATSKIKVFDFSTMDRVRTIKSKNHQVMCGVLSRGDEYLITGGKGNSKRDSYYIDIWNIETGSVEFSLMFQNEKKHDWITGIGLSEDERYIHYLQGSRCKVGMIYCEQFLSPFD